MCLNKKLVASLIMLIASGMANAADSGSGTIAFTGSVIDSPCSISADTLNQSISLGAISASSLQANGKSTPVPFRIQLQNCTFGTGTAAKNKVSVTFTGATVSGSSDKSLLSMGSSISGAGIGITSLNGTEQPVVIGTPTEAYQLSGENPVLKYEAYVESTGGKDTAITYGNFNTQVNFELAYN